MDEEPESMEEVITLLQQKIGNLELTVHSMIHLMEKKDLMDLDEVNSKAGDIVREMKDGHV